MTVLLFVDSRTNRIMTLPRIIALKGHGHALVKMNDTIEFLDHKSINLDTKIMILCSLFESYDKAKMLFAMTSALTIVI